jgi:lipopolysaccharide export system protein LptA
MKNCFILALLVGLAAPISAQTVTNAAKAPMVITGDDGGDFNMETGLVVLRGNVQVDDPQMNLKCDLLTVKFTTVTNKADKPSPPAPKADTTGTRQNQEPPTLLAAQRIESIVAESRVVMLLKKDNSRATGGKAVYTAATDTVELTQDATVQMPQGLARGQLIVYDRANGKVSIPGKYYVELNLGAFGKTNGLGRPKPAKPAAPQ